MAKRGKRESIPQVQDVAAGIAGQLANGREVESLTTANGQVAFGIGGRFLKFPEFDASKYAESAAGTIAMIDDCLAVVAILPHAVSADECNDGTGFIRAALPKLAVVARAAQISMAPIYRYIERPSTVGLWGAEKTPVLALRDESKAALRELRDAATAPTRSPAAVAEPLTDQQQAAFDFIREHGPKSAKEIAQHLGLDESTVSRHHVPALKARNLVRNKRGAGYYALES